MTGHFSPHHFLFLLLLFLARRSSGADLYHICSTTGNYTSKSPYEANLNTLLSTLPSNAAATAGYSNATAGDPPDRVSGQVLCRGDVTATDCSTCLRTAANDILKLCPRNKAATIWYDYCLLRFSNLLIFSSIDGTKIYFRGNGNVSDMGLFNERLGMMMEALVDYSVKNSTRFFATGEVNYTDFVPLIYGLTQCSRDLSAEQCEMCLKDMLRQSLVMVTGGNSGRILGVSCNFRFEVFAFYKGKALVSIPAQRIGMNSTLPSPGFLPSGNKENGTRKVLVVALPLAVVLVLISICICFWRRRKRAKKTLYGADKQELVTIESLLFNLSTLRIATNNFSDSNKLGEGGFGAVYKGVLPDGQEIAVKKLSTRSSQGIEELKNEVVLLAKLQHRNLVRLLGVCLEEQEKLLVYEFVLNRSLDTFLYDPTKNVQLNWGRRYKIIEGIARGLLYLHEESQVKIVHRDLKASNILLDADMNSKISDFGLARLIGGDQTQADTNRVVGTYGYMAPEYAMRGQFSVKSDVFSFGVLVLEIVTGRKNNSFLDSNSSPDLLSYVWEHWTEGRVSVIIDPSLVGQCRQSEVLRCIHMGLLCFQEAPAIRPSVSSIVLMLNSYSMALQVPLRPAFVRVYRAVRSDVLTKEINSYGLSPTQSSTLNELSVSEFLPR